MGEREREGEGGKGRGATLRVRCAVTVLVHLLVVQVKLADFHTVFHSILYEIPWSQTGRSVEERQESPERQEEEEAMEEEDLPQEEVDLVDPTQGGNEEEYSEGDRVSLSESGSLGVDMTGGSLSPDMILLTNSFLTPDVAPDMPQSVVGGGQWPTRCLPESTRQNSWRSKRPTKRRADSSDTAMELQQNIPIMSLAP